MGKRWSLNATSAAVLGAALAIAGCHGTPASSAPGSGRVSSTTPRQPNDEGPDAAVLLGGGRSLVGPFTHANLSVFLIANPGIHDAREFITLDEGLTAGTVVVNERGATAGRDDSEVNSLEISNRSRRWLYIEAGEVLKGGKQDRTVGRDLVVAPKAMSQPMAAFCVERGRWRAAGGGARSTAWPTPCPVPTTSTYSYTPTTYFPTYYPATPTPTAPTTPTAPVAPSAPTTPSAPTGPPSRTTPTTPSTVTAPSAATPSPAPSNGPTGPAAPGMRFRASRATLAPSMKMAILKEKDQGRVWAGVAKQRSAWGATESSSGTWMDVARSEGVQSKIGPYVKALEGRFLNRTNVVGVVFVRDGVIVAADEYGAPGLFRRLYPKLLAAHARVAALSRMEFDGALPRATDVKTFLDEAATGDETVETTANGQSLRTCENARAITFDAKDGAKLVHRNILLKHCANSGR